MMNTPDESTVRETILERDAIFASEFEDMLEDLRIMVMGGEDPKTAFKLVFDLDTGVEDPEVAAAIESALAQQR